MKIRIQDNSVRFRISIKELEQLNAEGRIAARTIPQLAVRDDPGRCFSYGVEKAAEGAPSLCDIRPGGIVVRLNSADVACLNDPSIEGVYLRHEESAPDGTVHRFIAFVEKDRPATRCDKPEAWIYEYAHETGADRTLVPKAGSGR